MISLYTRATFQTAVFFKTAASIYLCDIPLKRVLHGLHRDEFILCEKAHQASVSASRCNSCASCYVHLTQPFSTEISQPNHNNWNSICIKSNLTDNWRSNQWWKNLSQDDVIGHRSLANAWRHHRCSTLAPECIEWVLQGSGNESVNSGEKRPVCEPFGTSEKHYGRRACARCDLTKLASGDDAFWWRHRTATIEGN